MKGVRTAAVLASRWVVLTAAFLAVAVAGPARSCQAESVTYNTVVDSLSQIGFFPQFNPNLGILREVDLHATGSAGQDFSFLSQPHATSVNYVGILAISFATSSPIRTTGFGAGPITGTVTGIPPFDPTVGVGFSYDISSIVPIISQSDVYIGTSQFNVGGAVTITVFGAPVSPIVQRGSPSVSGPLSVTYVYDLVPEPTSSTMAVIALVMLAAVRKRLARCRLR
jgi:hypothetical protein